jgi:hypothetical protein
MNEFVFKLYNTLGSCKKRVIPACAYVETCLEGITDLTHQNTSRGHRLAAKRLNPTPLAFAVTSVPGCALTFFMRHLYLPFCIATILTRVISCL